MPLDAHGNPIGDDSTGGEDVHHLHVIADEERQPLAASGEHDEQVSRTVAAALAAPVCRKLTW